MQCRCVGRTCSWLAAHPCRYAWSWHGPRCGCCIELTQVPKFRCLHLARIQTFIASQQDWDTGFTEEEAAPNKKRVHGESKAPPPELPAHFALPGTPEHGMVCFTFCHADGLGLDSAACLILLCCHIIGTFPLHFGKVIPIARAASNTRSATHTSE